MSFARFLFVNLACCFITSGPAISCPLRRPENRPEMAVPTETIVRRRRCVWLRIQTGARLPLHETQVGGFVGNTFQGK